MRSPSATTSSRSPTAAKAAAGLDDVTRTAMERAEEKVLEEAQPPRDSVVALASHD